MRKLSIVFMAVLIAAIAGCAGDDSSGDTGTLTTVQDLQLDASSAGRSIVLVWSEIADEIDGYKIYFKADGTGEWSEIGESVTTTFPHTATSAGTYSVRAYKGDNYSEAYSTTATTMPNIVNYTYTIYDNFSPSDKDSGFFFGLTSGETGSAASSSFQQDIYAYDDVSKGDNDVSLYSGNKGSFPTGYQSYFQEPLANGYCEPAGSGTWFDTSYPLFTGDSVVFVALTGGSGSIEAYAKMRGLSIAPDPDSPNGTSVTFTYEIQAASLYNTGILTVFTTNAN